MALYGVIPTHNLSCGLMVGVAGFELAAPASRRQCSTRLSYTPIVKPLALLSPFVKVAFNLNAINIVGIFLSIIHKEFYAENKLNNTLKKFIFQQIQTTIQIYIDFRTLQYMRLHCHHFLNFLYQYPYRQKILD